MHWGGRSQDTRPIYEVDRKQSMSLESALSALRAPTDSRSPRTEVAGSPTHLTTEGMAEAARHRSRSTDVRRLTRTDGLQFPVHQAASAGSSDSGGGGIKGKVKNALNRFKN